MLNEAQKSHRVWIIVRRNDHRRNQRANSTGLTGSGVLCTLSFTTNPNVNSITSVTPLNVYVTNAQGTDIPNVQFSGGTIFVGTIPAPSVGSFFPTAQSSGGTVIINGSNFTGATAVSFGATAAQSFIVNSATQISAVVGTGSSGAISVTAPGGTGSLAGFVYLTTPVISSFSPVSAAGSQAVTIDGSGFTGSSAVSFGGVPAASFTVNSPDQITAVIASGGTSGVVSVTNSYGTGTLPGFTFIPLPVINNFTPLSGGSGTIVTINGSGLTGTSAISFGGIPAQSFAVNSNTVITATVGSGSTGSVALTAPGGSTTSASSFNFILPPTITAFNPATGGAGASITITGINLETTSSVSFGGIAAQSFVINSDTQVIAVVGVGASGSVSDVTEGGTANQPGFTFIPPPVINSFSPSAGAAGIEVTITGSNFTGANIVNFGGVPAASFTIDNPTKITAIVGVTGASGSISVTTPGGTAGQTGFIFYSVPTITTFSPASGTTGNVITINGNGFLGATNVTFGGVSASSFTINSSTQITAIVGGGNTGSVDITAPGGNATIGGFTFVIPSATIGFFPATAVINNGSSFSVDLVVNTSTGLLSWQSDITFDPSKMQCTGIEQGDFLSYYASVNGGVSVPILNPVINNQNGTISNIGYTVLGVGMGGRSGSGTLCVLNFVANSPANGTGMITPINVSLNDANGNSLPDVSIQSCNITVNWPTPVITGFSPTPAGRGDIVTILGSNFNNASSVTFGGTTPNSFAIVSDTEITAVLGQNGSTGQVSVNTPGGTAVMSGFVFIPVWDVNRDGIGNILDVVLIGLHWNVTGTPGWIPEDINDDGVVNVLDVVILGLHWNATW